MLFRTRGIHGLEFQRITVDVLKADEGRLGAWIRRGVGATAYWTHAVFVIRKPVRAARIRAAARLHESLASERTALFTGAYVVRAGVGVADGYASVVLAGVAGVAGAFAATAVGVRSAYKVRTTGRTGAGT